MWKFIGGLVLALASYAQVTFIPPTSSGGGGGGSGTVTSVAQSFTGGLISVSGSPVTTSGTLALTVAGTSGGIPYFSSSSAWASSGALTAGALMVGGGAGAAPTVVANTSVPNAGEIWVGQQAPNASATRCLFCVGATAWASGSANGTALGVNVATGYTGDLFGLKINSVNRFNVDSTGKGTFAAEITGTFVIATNATGFICAANSTCQFAANQSGPSVALRLSGGSSSATASTNFLALRTAATDKIRINGDQGAVMIGQTVNTTSLSNMSLYVGDTTATTGVSRISFQEGPGQSTTNGFEYRLTNATANAGTLVWSIASGGIPQWGSTTEATCASGTRGQIVMVQGGAGVLDTLRVCRKDAADAYAWTALY